MKEHIRASAPFDRLSGEVLDVLEKNGHWKSLLAGEQLFAAGDKGDAMYIVAEGQLQVLIPGTEGEDIVVAELGIHSVVGEIQILTGGKRTATVRALVLSRLIEFKRAIFDWLTETEPEAIAEINSTILRRLRRNQLAAILTSYFGSLTHGQIGEIESLCQWVMLRQGETLMRQGDPGDSFYVLVSGTLGGLIRDVQGNDKLVNRIRHGEVVGEMALLTNEPRSATIYAIREAELVRFPKEEFFVLLEKYPRFLLQLSRMIIKRLKQLTAADDRETSTTIISLIPSSAEAPLGEFASRLAQELSTCSQVLHLNSAKIDEILEMPGVSQAPKNSPLSTRFSAWLSSQDGKYQFILLETDHSDTNWTRRCVWQSDQVITVGLSGADPSLSGIESLLYTGHYIGDVPMRLVLVHPDDCERPRGTGKWLECRQVQMHHHVRLGNQEDFRRLSRFITGSAVCLALGGGGARGFAHIGAFRALREADVPIDIIGGTSMGAVIGAELALGISPEEMIGTNKGMFSNVGLLLDLTLPLLSFTTGKAYAGTLRKVFGDVAIEDLWIPFFCVSSNISRATMALHRTGLLRQKLRASSGVQGLFPPVVIDGELHVDGALFSNLPADVMKSVCRGKVIAIDVTPPVDLAETTDYGETISGWKILWNRLFPRKKRFQSVDLGTVMQRSAEAASMASQKRVIKNMADYYLLMPVQEINLLNFGAILKLSEIGYSSAKEKITEWQGNPNWIRP